MSWNLAEQVVQFASQFDGATSLLRTAYAMHIEGPCVRVKVCARPYGAVLARTIRMHSYGHVQTRRICTFQYHGVSSRVCPYGHAGLSPKLIARFLLECTQCSHKPVRAHLAAHGSICALRTDFKMSRSRDPEIQEIPQRGKLSPITSQAVRGVQNP